MLGGKVIRIHEIKCPECGHVHYTENKIATTEFFACRKCRQRIRYVHFLEEARTCKSNNKPYKDKNKVKITKGETYYVELKNIEEE